MQTGILGGTFDPIHLGHLAAGEAALTSAGLDRVLFIPAGDPWQKSDRLISRAVDRVEMVRLAVDGHPGFQLDDREVERHGPSYTIDTLESFDPSEELSVVVGADAALGIPTWHRASEVLTIARILVVPRSMIPQTAVHDVVPEAEFLAMKAVDVSATDIRQLVRAGLPFEHLVGGEVAAYIKAAGLYTERWEHDRVVHLIDREERP